MKEARFVYASAKSREKIEAALEDCFASGEIVPAERPLIEKAAGRWIISLPME